MYGGNGGDDSGAEGQRRHAASERDLVRRLALKQTVADSLRQAGAVHGAASFALALRTVDESLLRQLSMHVTINVPFATAPAVGTR